MAGVNNNFKNETLVNATPTKEKVHYLGDLRIVGQVVEQVTDKEPIGYVVMTEKTQKFKMYTVGQTMVLLQKFKFVNAAIKNGKIVNTECSMERMPKFNTNMNVIGNYGIIILGEIVDGGQKVGYRAMDTNAKIVDLTEAELISHHLTYSFPLLNAKIVYGNNINKTTHISAIKQEFTKIEKSKLKDLPVENKVNPWIKEKHVEKLKTRLLKTSIKWGFTGIGKLNDNWMWRSRQKNGKDVDYRYLDLDKEAKIIISEVLTEKNGISLSSKDKAIIKRVVKEIKHHKVIGGKYPNIVKQDGNDKLFIFALAQFTLNNDEMYKKALSAIPFNARIQMNNFDTLVKMNLASDSLIRFANNLRRRSVEKTRENVEYDKHKMFTTKTFTTGEEAAQLGFALNESNKDMKYETKTGNVKTLKFVGDYFTDGEVIVGNYLRYKDESRCLGDILAVADVIKLMNKCLIAPDNNNGAGREYLPLDRMIASIEIIIAISFLYESRAMKDFVDEYKEELERIGIDVPDYEEVSSTDYKLSPELKMYYASGFNVFLNDKHGFKKSYLRNSEIINYRQYGNKHDIKHTMLKDELASVVTMVTNGKHCDAESVTEYIGRIRFL